MKHVVHTHKENTHTYTHPYANRVLHLSTISEGTSVSDHFEKKHKYNASASFKVFYHNITSDVIFNLSVFKLADRKAADVLLLL